MNVAWRVVVIAVVTLLFDVLLGLLMGTGPSAQDVALDLGTGALYALALLPLARRLPYGRLTRFLALFVPLYWIAYLSNLVEAWVDTTIAHRTLVEGAIFLAIPVALVAVLIAWLFPAARHGGPVPGIRELLGERPLLSWAWRILLVGILYAVLLEVFGAAYGPLIARYYQDPAFMAQSHTSPAPGYVAWPEEIARGILFALVLLPVLAVVRGRDWPRIAWAAAYVTLIGIALEAWAVFAMTSFPIGFRLGEGLDLTTDAVARGIIVAALLVLPARGIATAGEAVALA
jgi:hypothetical protein